MRDGAKALFFAPSSKSEAAQATHDLHNLRTKAPIAAEAFIEAKKCLLLGIAPWPGGLEDQPVWFTDTMDWLARHGMLEGPFRGGF